MINPGLNPAQLLCKPVRLKHRRDETKGGAFLCAPPPSCLPGDGRRQPRAQGGIEPWPAWMFCRVSETFQLGSAVAAWFRLFGTHLVSASLSYFS